MNGVRAILRLAVIGAFLTAMPAAACSPRLVTLTQAMATEQMAIEASTQVVSTQRNGDFVFAVIVLNVSEFIKWPRDRARPRRIKVRDFAVEDGANCPAWFWNDGVRYFTLRPNRHGRLILTGTFHRR